MNTVDVLKKWLVSHESDLREMESNETHLSSHIELVKSRGATPLERDLTTLAHYKEVIPPCRLACKALKDFIDSIPQ